MFKEYEVASKSIHAGYCSCTEIDISSSHFRHNNNYSQLILGLLPTQLSSICAPLTQPFAMFIKSSLEPAVQASFSWLGHWMSSSGVPGSQPQGLGREQLPLAPSTANAWSFR